MTREASEAGSVRAKEVAVRSTRGPLVASYFDGRFLTAVFFGTSVGDMSIRPGRGCSWAMCVERRLVATRSPQNRQRALPGEMWTRCIPNSMSGSLFARQAHGEPRLLSLAYISTGVDPRIEATAALPGPYPFFSRHLL